MSAADELVELTRLHKAALARIAVLETAVERDAYSRAHTCVRLDIGEEKLRELTNSGRIEVRKLDSKPLYTADAIRAFLASLPDGNDQ